MNMMNIMTNMMNYTINMTYKKFKLRNILNNYMKKY
jgi:hypothetical protein